MRVLSLFSSREMVRVPSRFFTSLAQVIEVEPDEWNASSWTKAGHCLSCEWRLDGLGGGVWRMECGEIPRVVLPDNPELSRASRNSGSQPAGSRNDAKWRSCVLQLRSEDFLDILSGVKNANQAVFDRTMKVAGDFESLPLLNIALAKMKDCGSTMV
jgi:hypothetical protein